MRLHEIELPFSLFNLLLNISKTIVQKQKEKYCKSFGMIDERLQSPPPHPPNALRISAQFSKSFLWNADVWKGSPRELEVSLHVLADDWLFQLAVDVVPFNSVLDCGNGKTS